MLKVFLNTVKSIKIYCPPMSKVLIFDDMNSYLLKDRILLNIHCSIIETRFERIYLGLPIISRMVVNYFTLKKKVAQIERKLLRPDVYLYLVYLFSCIKYIGPKVILTFTDNNVYYGYLSLLMNNIEFISIQNGIRIPYSSKLEIKLVMPHYYCFGNYEKELYQNHGYSVQSITPVGSLKGGLAYEDFKVDNRMNKSRFSVCHASQWRADVMKGGKYPSYKYGYEILNDFLSKSVAENKFNIAIGALSDEAAEKEYFELKYRGEAKVFERHLNKQGIFSTYEVAANSDVLVVMDSTVGLELLGWGMKVMFCNFSEDREWDLCGGYLPESLYREIEDIIVCKKNNYEEFNSKLLLLMSMDVKKYRERILNISQYCMAYDFDRPAHIQIRDRIIEAIGGDDQ